MIRLTFIYLLRLIKKNPVKIFYIILATVCYNYTDYFNKDVEVRREIIDTVTIKNSDYNIFYDDQNRYVYSSVQPNVEIETINGVRYEITYRSDYFKIALVSVSIVMVSLLLISFIIDIPNIRDGYKQETWFGFSDIMNQVLIDMIKCSLENNIYYYTIFGRLIHKGDKISNFPELKLTNLRIYPKFKTPSEKRDFFIDKIIG